MKHCKKNSSLWKKHTNPITVNLIIDFLSYLFQKIVWEHKKIELKKYYRVSKFYKQICKGKEFMFVSLLI